MSALRFARPGHVTELRIIDDGCTPMRSGHVGGELVRERPVRTKVDLQRERRAREAAK